MPTDTVPLLERIANGRTDLVFDYLAAGNAATAADGNGVSLMQHCAYYGDVSPIRYLLANGASLGELGDDLGLNGACFHGHWRLAQFLLEQGADPNRGDPETGETPPRSAPPSAARTTASCACFFPTEPIPTMQQKTARRPADSCATSVPAAKLR